MLSLYLFLLDSNSFFQSHNNMHTPILTLYCTNCPILMYDHLRKHFLRICFLWMIDCKDLLLRLTQSHLFIRKLSIKVPETYLIEHHIFLLLHSIDSIVINKFFPLHFCIFFMSKLVKLLN